METHDYEGPIQSFSATPNFLYAARAYVKLLDDAPGKIGQTFDIEMDYVYADLKEVRVKIQGPDPGLSFLVDAVSVTNIWRGTDWKAPTDDVINAKRKSDIHVHVKNRNKLARVVILAGKIIGRPQDQLGEIYNMSVLQKKKSFPIGTAVNAWKYLDQQQGGYRNFIHKHFNWAVHESLEHWDVNNENLHGFWYQERLHDFSYEQQPFAIAHATDPHVKLFLNDYKVVAHGDSTGAYVDQAKRLKAANVGLYGLGAQCHFWNEEQPDPILIKHRLDALAKTGLPVWITEFNVVAADENKRADYLETALRAFYGHPAVEGILLWGFWDQQHSRGPHAALVTGDNLELAAAGRRFLDLWENQWMTDETHVLSQAGNQFTVRGFHGDYEVHVRYRGHELGNLKKTFTLGKSSTTVNVNVHV
nr:hypothetical protein BaRGS_020185 [Batillaria attramentaria]